MPPSLRARCRYLAAIETSCDETSFSVLECDFSNLGEADATADLAGSTPATGLPALALPHRVRVLAHLVHSQGSLHEPFGGVVPEVAARDHLAHLPALAREGLRRAGLRAADCGAIAVTAGPGLIGAVMVGYLFAQGFAEANGIPCLAVNHVDAHLAPASLIPRFDPSQDCGTWLSLRKPAFPRLSLTVSGGHCLMAFWPEWGQQILLGTTLDDACGEAFDKVAKLLGLGYPGGPLLEAQARLGDTGRFAFPVPLSTGTARTRQHAVCPLPFSFSGLKTAALRATQACRASQGEQLGQKDIADIAACFQDAATHHLCDRITKALELCATHPNLAPVAEIVVAGGVAANGAFRAKLAKATNVPLFFAPLSLCGDNATMIALQALLQANDGRHIMPFSRYDFAPTLTGHFA